MLKFNKINVAYVVFDAESEFGFIFCVSLLVLEIFEKNQKI